MADHGRTDELNGIIEGIPLTGSVVWVHDADIAGGTEPGRRVLLESLPEQTRKLDLQILESLRGRAEYASRREPTHAQIGHALSADETLVGPMPTAGDFDPHPTGDATEVVTNLPGMATARAEATGSQARRGPPPPAHRAQWFDDLDLEAGASDTSPNGPLPWMDADRPRTKVRAEPPVRGEAPVRRRLLAQAEVAIVDMAYRYPGWGMVRVTNALRRQGIDVNVKEVSEVLSRYGVWSPLGRAALQKERAGRSSRSSLGRRLLLGFEMLAFATLTLAVAMAWLSI